MDLSGEQDFFPSVLAMSIQWRDDKVQFSPLAIEFLNLGWG